jgi:hypothetical protein
MKSYGRYRSRAVDIGRIKCEAHHERGFGGRNAHCWRRSARLLAALGAAGFIVVLGASFPLLVPLQRRVVAAPPASQGEMDAMRLRWFSGNLGRTFLAVAFVRANRCSDDAVTAS